MYERNRRIFERDAYKVQSADKRINDLDGLFHVIFNGSSAVATPDTSIWRINRMAPARTLRTLFPLPKTIPPNAGIDIERIITFDIHGGIEYRLPTTDCSNMFVYQAIGSRVIHLQPTTECVQHCRQLTVKLEQNYTCMCLARLLHTYKKFDISLLPLNRSDVIYQWYSCHLSFLFLFLSLFSIL